MTASLEIFGTAPGHPSDDGRAALMIVDDDPLVLLYLRGLVASHPRIRLAASCTHPREVLPALASTAIDVLLMDIQAGPRNGIMIATAARHRFPHLRIVLMSSSYDSGFDQDARNAGADVFVSKGAPVDTLIRALWEPSEHTTGHADEDGDLARLLSSRERLIAGLAGEGLTNEQIARETHLSPNTVKTYLSRVFRKTGAQNRVELANLVASQRWSTSARS